MLLLGAHPRHTLLWSSLPLCLGLLCLNRNYPGSSSPHHSNTAYEYWCYLYLYPLSSVLSLTLLTHLTHSYLLLPHLIFCDSESAYSFYLCPPPMFIISVCLCAGSALNYVVFSVWGLLLEFPSLDINLGQLHLSSLQQPSLQES